MELFRLGDKLVYKEVKAEDMAKCACLGCICRVDLKLSRSSCYEFSVRTSITNLKKLIDRTTLAG